LFKEKQGNLFKKYGGACTRHYLGVPKVKKMGMKELILMQPKKA
jgi:hypothetical protein